MLTNAKLNGTKGIRSSIWPKALQIRLDGRQTFPYKIMEELSVICSGRSYCDVQPNIARTGSRVAIRRTGFSGLVLGVTQAFWRPIMHERGCRFRRFIEDEH